MIIFLSFPRLLRVCPKTKRRRCFLGATYQVHVGNDAANHHHGFEDHGDERRGQRTRGRGDVHQVARHLTCMWGRYSEKNIIHTVPLLHLLIMHGSKGLLKYPRGIILYSPRKTLKHRMSYMDQNGEVHVFRGALFFGPPEHSQTNLKRCGHY